MSEPSDPGENLSHAEARAFLRVSKSTLDRLSKQRPELKRYLPGGRRPIFRCADLRRLLDEGCIKPKDSKNTKGDA
jgi:hypothetical protein